MNDILNEVFNNAETFVIVTHNRPDGDAISSSLSMFWYLVSIGKKSSNIDVIIPEFLNDFSFLPGIENLKKSATKENYDVAIVVDCSNMYRIEQSNVLKCAKITVCFDHHEKTLINTTHKFIDSSAPSCTCIIYKILHCTSTEFLTCIATGLISDTSYLKLNVTDEAINIINELKKCGIDIEDISTKISSASNRTKELAELAKNRGYFSNDSNNSIFCTYLLQKDLLDSEKSLNTLNHKAIIAELQQTVGYSSLILLIENNKGEYRGSLRTFDEKIDLNTVCSKLVLEGKLIKGGGHSYSSGCTAVGSRDTIFNFIVSEISNCYK